MYENIKWLFFDVGSTLMDEHIAYEHRMKDIARLANVTYEEVYEKAMELYGENKKGDIEIAKALGVELPKWLKEDEILYDDAEKCLEILSRRYKIGIIANQSLGTKVRLEKHGVLRYIDIVVASAEEGVSKPDKRIFEIALKRANCEPDNAIMLGDRIDNDIIPAKSLGIHTIWVKQGFGRYWNITKEIERADCAVDSLTELFDIL